MLTIYGGRQQCGHNLSLALLVLIEEALEAVEHSTAQNKGLPLVHHGHEQHHDGRPGGHKQRLVRIWHEIKADGGQEWLSRHPTDLTIL